MIRRAASIVAVSVFTLIFFARASAAATISFDPNTRALEVGDEFEVTVKINTQKQAINALEGVMVYPKERVEIIALSSANSFITVWAREPAFNKLTGRVEFAGGLPAPGFTGVGEIFKIRFRGLRSGAVSLNVRNVRILANDGEGTNIFTSAKTALYAIEEPAPVIGPTPPLPPEAILPPIEGEKPPLIEAPVMPLGPEVRPEVLPSCADGYDNDNDGRVDYPADQGCGSLSDQTETDPVSKLFKRVISARMSLMIERIITRILAVFSILNFSNFEFSRP
ncbi:MAG: hypothetical protein UX17_C0008G0010 [Parcubacteria group bacterium GW2011_GWC2_45_7]|nr:MAG: hypothetical protein UX17_C0008G0010 [Parcubacteria group bacterium GW2011_GWC2_45_7]KKU73356.1 MAG: hypothetical protein UX98_C0008G0022 [Parcubacteria group bacterium GW2011_GWA2_47_26]